MADELTIDIISELVNVHTILLDSFRDADEAEVVTHVVPFHDSDYVGGFIALVSNTDTDQDRTAILVIQQGEPVTGQFIEGFDRDQIEKALLEATESLKEGATVKRDYMSSREFPWIDTNFDDYISEQDSIRAALTATLSVL